MHSHLLVDLDQCRGQGTSFLFVCTLGQLLVDQSIGRGHGRGRVIFFSDGTFYGMNS